MTETCTCTNLEKFTRSTRPVAKAIVSTVNDFVDYWPLTVRQVYYQLVASGEIANNQDQYRKVSRILTQLRVDGNVSWDAIEDRSRRTVDKRGRHDLGEFLNNILSYLHPKNYGRCYVQDQSNYVEVSTEKDALSAVFENNIWMYCTRLNVLRGQVSATMVEAMARRFDNAVMRGQNPILLHFGDLDPSGVAIPKSLHRNLFDRHGVEVDVRVVALTPDQVEDFNLPCAPDAVKSADPNHHAWLAEYGPCQAAVELDALHPALLGGLIREALEDVYDMDAVAVEQVREREDRLVLENIQRDFKRLLADKYSGVL